MTTKHKGDSVRQKLTNLSGKMNVPYPNLETIFLIERLVARLVADKELSKRLGGSSFKTSFENVLKQIARLDKL